MNTKTETALDVAHAAMSALWELIPAHFTDEQAARKFGLTKTQIVTLKDATRALHPEMRETTA